MKNDALSSVAVTQDGGYIAAGFTESFNDTIDMLVIRTDSYGNQQWMKVIGSDGYITGANWLVACNDGGFAIVGNKQPIGSDNGDLYFIKTDSEGNISLNVEDLSDDLQHFVIYPNPATGTISLSYDNKFTSPQIRIYNAQGRMMFEGSSENKIDIAGLSEGIYIITLRQGNEFFTQRFSKM
jgi:hypothetical protein